MTYHRAIKEETIAINCERVYNQASRLSHDIHDISHSFITFNNLFKLITKIRLSNNCKLNRHNIQMLIHLYALL